MSREPLIDVVTGFVAGFLFGTAFGLFIASR